MPGSIRVSVLEAIELKTGDGKLVSAKVSIGKKEYTTPPLPVIIEATPPWNADFTFPVLNLKDNLSIFLLDDSGQVISKTDIQTPSIVEKGFRDEFLSLTGGGKIHVKLSFVLSDEERKRIEQMRSQSKKKVDVSKTVPEMQSTVTSEAGNLSDDATSTTSKEDKAVADLMGSSPLPTVEAPSSTASSTPAPPPAPAPAEGKISAGIVQQKITLFEDTLKQDTLPVPEVSPASKALERMKTEVAIAEKAAAERAPVAAERAPVAAERTPVAAERTPVPEPEQAIVVEKPKKDVVKKILPTVEKTVVVDEAMNGSGKVKATISKLRQEGIAAAKPKEEKRGGGVGKLFTQLVGGVAAVVGLVLLWPREEEERPDHYAGSRPDEESYYKVQTGDTLSRIVPDQCYNYNSEFFKLNPQVCDRNLIYAGQNLRLK